MSPGPRRACGRGPPPTPTRTPRSTGWCARCRASSARSPAGRRPTSNRPVSATPSPGSSSGGRSVASGATTAGRSPASCRWRSPISWPNPSRPTRSRPPSPGGESSTPRWGRGRRARRRSCWPIRPATTGAPPARRSSRAAGPGRWRRPSRRPPGKPASRSGPVPRSPTSPHGTGGRPASSWPAGDELTARAVVAGIDPKRALTGLADPVAIGPSLLWRAANIRTPGTVAKVNLVLSGLPVFPAAAGDARLLRGRILIAPGIDAMERAHDAAKYGRYSDAPMMEATIPSLADPSLVEGAAPGTHVMSVIVQATPYTLRDQGWDDARDAFGDLVVKALDGYAPGLAGLVTARQVLTPLDLERDYGLTGGHPMHGEHGLDQFFLWRPLLGHARYRIGLDGPLPGGCRRPSRRRGHRSERPERRARDRRGPEEATVLRVSSAFRRSSRPRLERRPTGMSHLHGRRRLAGSLRCARRVSRPGGLRDVRGDRRPDARPRRRPPPHRRRSPWPRRATRRRPPPCRPRRTSPGRWSTSPIPAVSARSPTSSRYRARSSPSAPAERPANAGIAQSSSDGGATWASEPLPGTAHAIGRSTAWGDRVLTLGDGDGDCAHPSVTAIWIRDAAGALDRPRRSIRSCAPAGSPRPRRPASTR